MTGRDVLLRLLSVLLLIAINAFFVTAEFSIVSVRRSRISQLVKTGDLQAQTVQSLQRSIDRLLSTTQLGITLSSLALGWIGESTMAVVVKKIIVSFPVSKEISFAIAHSFSVPIAFALIVYLQIVLGELCPKSVALLYPEQLARFFGPPSIVIARIFRPIVWILNQSTRFFLKLVGIKYTGQGWYDRVTPEELQLIIATEKESSGLEAEERRLLKNVFAFSDVIAAEVMTPRTNIACITFNAGFKELLEKVATTEHSRYPAIGESLDEIRGIIDFKDLALALAENRLNNETSIEHWIQPVLFIPESTPLSELLPLMQQSQLKMVVVVDEFGGTSGLITLQDLITKITGGTQKKSQNKEFALQKIDDETFLVPAQMNLEAVNEFLDIELPLADEYQTLGGFLFYQWQKIPTQGETLSYRDLDFTVFAAEGTRLHQILIHRHPSSLDTNGFKSDRDNQYQELL
jgi:CBS domain containing-hemolysin-like protein